MNILQKLRKYFPKNSEYKNRYTDWVLIDHDNGGYIVINGKEELRQVDVYERYDKLNKEYEVKHVYKLPKRFTLL